MDSSFKNIPDSGSASWKDPVETTASLPLTGNGNGDARTDISTGTVYVWDGDSWVSNGGSGDVTGPSSSVANSIAVFTNTSGKIIDDSNLSISGSTLQPLIAGSMIVTGFPNPAGAGSNLTVRGGNSTGGLGGACTINAGATQQSGAGATMTVTGGSNTVGGGGQTIVAGGTSNAASQSGGALSLRGGQPGSGGTPGSIGFTTGTSAGGNTRLTIDGTGNLIPGTAALATTATDGFIYNQSCAGLPTGVPTTATGRVPTIIDSTNKRLYTYIAGWVDPAINALLTGFSAAAGTVSATDSILTAINKIVGNIGLLATAEVSHGDMGSTETIDFATGPAHYGNISAACTVTLSNVVSGSAYSVVIEANGVDSITWAGPTIDWGTDGVPDFTALADGDLTLINFYYSGTKSVVLASYKSY